MRIFIFTVLLALGHSAIVGAQNQQGESAIGVNAAYSGVSAIGGLLNVFEVDDEVGYRYTPAYQLTYDYAIADMFSLGAALSYQRFTFRYTNYGDNLDNFNVKIGRTNVAARFLVHYGGGERFDMYSGLRAGITSWSVDVGTATTGFIPPIATAVAFAPQVILFGAKGYFSDRLGFNGEIAIGPPHLVSVGLSYRIEGKNSGY
jgi:hypothetical protein